MLESYADSPKLIDTDFQLEYIAKAWPFQDMMIV